MATPAAEPPSFPPFNSLPFIDMTTLTQSELHSLSLLSISTNPDPTPASPVTIDRTNFNESVVSRRQTYSRSSPHHHHHRHRLLQKATTENPTSKDTDRLENHFIIKSLKKLLSTHPEFSQLDLIEFDSFTHLNDAINFNNGSNNSVYNNNADSNFSSLQFRKRKRGRKPKMKVISIAEERERELVNGKGVVVDLIKLGSLEEDPYKDELKRRTEGLNSEEELLGFFRDINGQWCSRRRKRRIVDANEFGDFLPLGWKLLLALKRKEGKTWVYCRRYMSPNGQHFLTCKEVAAYLQSFPPLMYDARQVKGLKSDSVHHVPRLTFEVQARTSRKEDDQRKFSEQEKALSLLGLENFELADVQIQDLFECHKCNMTFDEKDTYLQHLLLLHSRTTRRYRLNSSVSDGVIVKDGKFECQFCHKVFDERRRYNGHVGIHVRNFVRGIDESPSMTMALQQLPESPIQDEYPTRISKMDALIEIAQNSIRETSSGPNGETSGEFTSVKNNVASNQELLASVSDHEHKSDSGLSEADTEYGMIDESREVNLHQQKSGNMIIEKRAEKIDRAGGVLDVTIDLCAEDQHGTASEALGGTDYLSVHTAAMDKSVNEVERNYEVHSVPLLTDGHSTLVTTDNQDNSKTDEVDKKSIEIEFNFGSIFGDLDNDIVQESGQQSTNDDQLNLGSSQQPASLLEPSEGLKASNVENKFHMTDERHDKISGFEELRLEDFEQLKYFGTGQDSVSQPEIPIDINKDTEMEDVYGVSVQLESAVAVDTAGGQQLTVCVWCGVEFTNDASDTEMQSDSVGYMCPTCKARISGQLDAFGGDCS